MATDVALETEDAAILRNRVTDAAATARLARAAMHKTRQDVTTALGAQGRVPRHPVLGLGGLCTAILADSGLRRRGAFTVDEDGDGTTRLDLVQTPGFGYVTTATNWRPLKAASFRASSPRRRSPRSGAGEIGDRPAPSPRSMR